MSDKTRPLLLGSRLVLALVALAAMGQQLVLHVAASYSVVNFFSYFTNLSNIFAAVVLLVSVWKSGGRTDIARYVSAVNMAIVGVVFAVLLRNVDLGGLLPWVNITLHYVMPVAVVLDWLLAPPSVKLRAKHLLLALVFPALYLGYVIVRGASIGWYPYPFLNPAKVGGYGMVAAYSLGIAFVYLLASGLLLMIGNRASSKQA